MPQVRIVAKNFMDMVAAFPAMKLVKLYDNAFICEAILRIEYQLPNLIVGTITKESLYNAFENGITADQIVSFLQQNAHPRVAQKIPAVPENVTDQIRLWETERNRVEITPASLYEEFPSKEVFEAASDYARELGALLYEDSKNIGLIVRLEVSQEMRFSPWLAK